MQRRLTYICRKLSAVHRFPSAVYNFLYTKLSIFLPQRPEISLDKDAVDVACIGSYVRS